MKNSIKIHRKPVLAILALGLAAAISYQAVEARRQPPTEHKGFKVSSLGAILEASMPAQIGLEGYKLQLREIVVEPRGRIAPHSHAGPPGLV